MERTEQLLCDLNAQLHELLGDHREFKRETLNRLTILEHDVKNIPSARRSALCATISIISGLVALAGTFGLLSGGAA